MLACWLRWSALLVAAFAVRAIGLARESFWRDEVDAILFARVPWPDLLHTFVVPAHNGPTYHVLVRLWVELVRPSSNLAVAAARITNCLPGRTPPPATATPVPTATPRRGAAEVRRIFIPVAPRAVTGEGN